jgi:immune inhibitor A
MVAPAPAVRRQVGDALRRATEAGVTLPGHHLRLRPPDRLGLNDGLIIPGTRFPLGTPPSRVRREAAERAPLRGALQVIVVLVEFPTARLRRPASSSRSCSSRRGLRRPGVFATTTAR